MRVRSKMQAGYRKWPIYLRVVWSLIGKMLA
jgi:hypothetical protein